MQHVCVCVFASGFFPPTAEHCTPRRAPGVVIIGCCGKSFILSVSPRGRGALNGIFVFIKLPGRNNTYLNAFVEFKWPANGGTTVGVYARRRTLLHCISPCLFDVCKARGSFRFTSRRPPVVRTFCGPTRDGRNRFLYSHPCVFYPPRAITTLFYRPASLGTFTAATYRAHGPN